MVQDTRSRIRACVVQYPGLHLREVARQLDMSLALLQYHLPQLVEKEQVQLVDSDGTQRLFPPKIVTDRRAIASLRDRHRLHVVLKLLEESPQRHADLVKSTGLGKSTLSFHLKRLAGVGLIEQLDGAYRLKNRAAAEALLAQHRPTPDLVDRFASLWGDLYG